MKAAILLFAAFSRVWADVDLWRAFYSPPHELYGRLAIAFFPDSQGDSCKANDISRAIALTTLTIPEANTCFNMSDIFSKNSSSGFQQSKQQGGGGSTPWGVDWDLINQDLYDENANYTHTWVRMVNELIPQEGRTSQWFYEQYTLPDCQDVRLGDEKSDDVPFYWINCQTDKHGSCKTATYPIGSFAVWRTVNYDEHEGDEHEGDDDCRRWTEFGAASTARINAGWLMAALVMAIVVVV
ncbi:uncharacterized protein Triagg1_53 [Trichoderma aggressivum f. europaeum]|uniref:SSCRP protein n=1 Tax=Trichoderma aggressivum f. europaeum TaxID=173218 RepID=A0AAE1IN45_9HYPO|nr:hypothetical protein Triagg1_53 [Trichoderma aggressivum f. europaeum]